VTILQLWDRQPAESGPAYAAFLAYRGLGPDRTLDDAYAARQAAKRGSEAGAPRTSPGQREGTQGAPGCWGKWSVKHRWVDRAAAWDAHLEKARQEAAIEEARKRATVSDAEWEVRKLAQRQAEWDLRTRLITRAQEMLAFPLAVKTSEEVHEQDGATIKRITVFKPARWAMATVVDMLKLATDLGRLATNMKPTPDETAPPDFGGALFDSGGELEDVLPVGAAPVMPEDPTARPDFAANARENNPHGLVRPPKARPPGE
jgi:hypothetical protein